MNATRTRSSLFVISILLAGACLLAGGCGASKAVSADGGHDAADATSAGDVTQAADMVEARDASEAKDAAAGDACADAACTLAAVETVAAPGCGSARLVLAGGRVYWTERATGTVKSLSTAEFHAAPTVVATGQPLPGSIAADDTNLYWANETDKTIMKAPLAGGAPTTLLTASDAVGPLLASGGVVYYGAGASLSKVAAAGGASTTLATFLPCRPSRPGSLALDADRLYQTDFSLQFITREKLDGTQASTNTCAVDPTTAPKVQSPETVTHTQGELLQDGITVVGGFVVWGDGQNVSAKLVTGTGGQLVATSVNGNPLTGFAIDGANVYLAEGEAFVPDGTGDTIERAAFDLADGGTADAVVIARGQQGARDLVADATHLYWVTRTGTAADAGPGDCTIARLAK